MPVSNSSASTRRSCHDGPLVAGTSEAVDLAQLAKGRMRAKIPELQRALAGSFRQHHQFMVARHLAYIDAIDEIVAQVSGEIALQYRGSRH